MLGGYGGCIMAPTGVTPPIQTASPSYGSDDVTRAEVVTNFIAGAWNGSSPADRAKAVYSYVDEHYGYTLGGDSKPHGNVLINDRLQMQGPDDLIKLIEACHAAARQLHVEPEQLIVVDELVIVRLTTSGQLVGRFELPTAGVYRVPNRKITESWHLLDWKSLRINP